jgi:hypothetical protein
LIGYGKLFPPQEGIFSYTSESVKLGDGNMFNSIYTLFQRMYGFISRLIYTFFRLQQNIDDIKVLHGKLLETMSLNKVDIILANIQNAEFKIFSQWGDDGIISFLVVYLEIDCKVFIEFGVEDYTESNTRLLLKKNNWRGMVMDGSKKNIKRIKKDNIYWQHELLAEEIFITRENINAIINDSGFYGEIGLLHIDIDGNDYWIWKEIDVIKPIIVIVEYNSVFAADKAWTVPYDPLFVRSKAHHSCLFYGASLKALVQLGAAKGYSLIGSNSNGNNAYFVRNDRMKDLEPLTAEEGYMESKFRESRDKKGNYTFISGAERLELLRGLNIYNVEKNKTETI